MHFRLTLTLTLALALTGLLSGILGVWLALDIVMQDMAPNVLFNVVLLATGICWPCTLGALRRERERQGCVEDFNVAVRQLWD
jgi:hypothetical protein